MSSQMPGLQGPPSDCTACRLGHLTIPTVAGDIRGWPVGVDGEPINQSRDGEGDSETVGWARLYRTNVVQGDGPVPCPVMLIGEAPGFQEDRDGIGFRPTAAAGRVLDAAMREAGLCRQEAGTEGPMYCLTVDHGVSTPHCPVYMTNALKCRPVDNKIDKFLDCLETCRSLWLTKEIEAVRPRVIVALGKIAAQPWFGKESALSVRKLFKDSTMLGPVEAWAADWDDRGGVLIIHAPHPSNIARGAAENRPKLVNALKLAKEIGYGQGA